MKLPETLTLLFVTKKIKEWECIERNAQEQQQAKELSEQYLKARADFKTYADTNPLLQGNDNFIGRIAEMLVIEHFFEQDKNLCVSRPGSQSNKGIDLRISDHSGVERDISVKCITHESKSGRSSGIRWPNDMNTSGELLRNPPPPQFELWVVLIEKSGTSSIHNLPRQVWLTPGWKNRKRLTVSRGQIEKWLEEDNKYQRGE